MLWPIRYMDVTHKSCSWLRSLAESFGDACAADDMDEMVNAVKHAIMQCCIQVQLSVVSYKLATMSCLSSVVGGVRSLVCHAPEQEALRTGQLLTQCMRACS